LRVIALNQIQLLGHDPTREPDAVQDVYQAECVFVIDSNDDDHKNTNPNPNPNPNTGSNSNSNTDSNDNNKNVTDSYRDISSWAESIGLNHSQLVRNREIKKSLSPTALIVFLIVIGIAYTIQSYRK
jgi:hypothetical protein